MGRITWTLSNAGTDYLYCVTHTGSQYLAAGRAGVLQTSSDGVHWTQSTFQTKPWNSLIYEPGVGYTMAGTGPSVATSANGTQWNLQSQPISGTTAIINSVHVGNGTYMLGCNSGYIGVSTNRSTWTRKMAPGTDFHWYSGAYGNGVHLMVGAWGAIGRSVDNGNSFSRYTAPVEKNIYTVVWTGEQFVCGQVGGNVCLSREGSAWEGIETGATGMIRGICCHDGLLVGVTLEGEALTSTDGRNWSVETIPGFVPANYLYDICWGPQGYVAVGMNGTIALGVPQPGPSVYLGGTQLSGLYLGENSVAQVIKGSA